MQKLLLSALLVLVMGISLQAQLIFTGMVDGPLTGGTPKAIELYAVSAIPDLSVYNIKQAVNGGQPSGSGFTFPAGSSATAGQFIYVASESVQFNNYFGFAPTYTSSVAGNNGDDAVVLFLSGVAVDHMGLVGQDGTGQCWDYEDGWMYRTNTAVAPIIPFACADWTFSGANALDACVTSTNATCASMWPLGTYAASAPMDCAGTPDAGTAASTLAVGCPGNAYTVSLTGQTTGQGIGIQWQESANGTTWTDVSGATSSSYTGSLAADIYFRAIVTCTPSASSDTSNSVFIDLDCNILGQLIITGMVDGPLSGGTPKAIELYAISDIPDLTIYTVDNATNGGAASAPVFSFPSGSSAVAGQYIYISSEATQFNNYFGFAPDYTSSVANNNGDDVVIVYENGVAIDYFGQIGQDGTGQCWDYEDGWAYRKPASNTATTTFACGNWDFSGANALDACAAATNSTCASVWPLGTYDIAPQCSGAPDAGVATATVSTACAGTSFNIALSGQTPDAGIAYQWEESLNGTSWTAISGATSATVTTSLTATTNYRAIVSCTSSQESDTSNTVVVTLNTSLCECACASYATVSGSSKIDSIWIGNAVFGSDTAACETYTLHTASGVVFTKGATVSLKVRDGSCSAPGGNYFPGNLLVVADWAGNGNFTDAGDTLYVFGPSTAANTIPPTTFTVPTSAVAGATTFRVIWRGQTTPAEVCGTYSFGETEDFCVTVEEAVQPCAVKATNMKGIVQSIDEVIAVWKGGDPSQNTVQVSYRVKGATNWTNRTTSIDAELPNNSLGIRPVGGFIPDTLYDLRVRFRCPDLTWTPYSDTARFSTYRLSDPTDCRKPEKVGFVYLKRNGVWVHDTVSLLTDKRAGGSMTAKPYFVSWKPTASATWLSRTQAFPKYNAVNLMPSTQYEYRWRTWCDATNRWSAFLFDTLTTLPAPPAPLNGTDISRNELNDVVAMGSVFAFPNPADDFVNIFFENGDTLPVLVRVFDTQGRQVASLIPTTDLERLDISTFASGTYILQVIQSDQSVVTEKIVKF